MCYTVGPCLSVLYIVVCVCHYLILKWTAINRKLKQKLVSLTEVVTATGKTPCMKMQCKSSKQKNSTIFLAKLGYNANCLADGTCSSQIGLPRFSKWKYCMGHTHSKKLFVVYLKFRFNRSSCILSGNSIPRSEGGGCSCMWVSALERLEMGKPYGSLRDCVCSVPFSDSQDAWGD